MNPSLVQRAHGGPDCFGRLDGRDQTENCVEERLDFGLLPKPLHSSVVCVSLCCVVNPFSTVLTSVLLSKLEVRQSDHGRAHEKQDALGLLRLGNKCVVVMNWINLRPALER